MNQNRANKIIKLLTNTKSNLKECRNLANKSYGNLIGHVITMTDKLIGFMEFEAGRK